MKQSAIVSGSTPGKPAIKTNRRQGEPSSRKSLFDFKTEKVCIAFLHFEIVAC
jgi:hypothetical protein